MRAGSGVRLALRHVGVRMADFRPASAESGPGEPRPGPRRRCMGALTKHPLYACRPFRTLRTGLTADASTRRFRAFDPTRAGRQRAGARHGCARTRSCRDPIPRRRCHDHHRHPAPALGPDDLDRARHAPRRLGALPVGLFGRAPGGGRTRHPGFSGRCLPAVLGHVRRDQRSICRRRRRSRDHRAGRHPRDDRCAG